MRLKTTEQKCRLKHNSEYYSNLDYTKLKLCSECKKKQPLSEYNKHRKQPDGFVYKCRTCLKNSYHTIPIKLAQHKSRAKKKGLEFNITLDDLHLPKYCPILGMKLDYSTLPGWNSPSIDRIDNSKGYIKGNVMIVSIKANAMKSNATFDELRTFCKNMPKLIKNYEMQGALGDVTDIFPNAGKHSLDL